jgi:hypothetical protein
MNGKTRFPRPAALAGLFIPIAVLAACGGKGVTIGSDSGELKTVDPTTVSGTAPACAPQAAHPNVCCKGGPNEASDCVGYVNSPFHKCDDDRTTYPDPGTCCDLNDPTKCASPPPGPPPPTGCGYACAPGWWPVVNNPGECCHILPSGNALECAQSDWGYPEPPITVGCATGGGTGSADGGVIISDGGVAVDASPPIDAGPVPDGGAPNPVPDPNPVPPPIDCDAGAPPPVPAPPPWPGPVCTTPCPTGFSPLPADPTICCALEPNGGEICFSQAGGPAGGPTGVVFGSGGKGASAGGTAGSTGSGSASPGK